ncbi:MAG: hypothetical protein IJV74_01010 [Clostridia bacterium]|nr:hypothetical protein [Clostridia bacterium]
MRKRDRYLEREERRKEEQKKHEKKIKKVKRSTTFFYWVLWGVMLGTVTAQHYLMGLGGFIPSFIMLGFAILAWKNAYHRGLFKTLGLPVGYGLGMVVLAIVRFFIESNFITNDFVNLLCHTQPYIFFYYWLLGAAPALVGVILGSLFGIGYRRKLRG